MRMHTPQRQYHLPAPLRAPARCRARSHPSYGTTALPAGISLTVPTVDHHVLPFPPRDSLLTQGQAVLNIDLQSTKDGFSECVLIFDECRWFPEATLSLCCVLLGSCLLQVSQVVSLEMNPAWKHSFFFFFLEWDCATMFTRAASALMLESHSTSASNMGIKVKHVQGENMKLYSCTIRNV